MTAHAAALRVSGLHTRYGTRHVLRGIDLDIYTGEIYGLLGPNGAGKTTLIRAICGRVAPTSGTVQIAGAANTDRQALRQIGLVPQEIALYGHLTVKENLDVFGRLSGLSGKTTKDAVEWAGHAADLGRHMNDRVDILSGGWKRRANIAAAILHQPSLLILDEPTVGVDVDARNGLHELILALSRAGMGILLTTHDMEQAETLCSTVGFLRGGLIDPQGHPRDLINDHFQDHREVIVELRSPPTPAQQSLLYELGMAPSNSILNWSMFAQADSGSTGQFADELEQHHIGVREVRLRAPGLDTLFVQLTRQADSLASGNAA